MRLKCQMNQKNGVSRQILEKYSDYLQPGSLEVELIYNSRNFRYLSIVKVYQPLIDCTGIYIKKCN